MTMKIILISLLILSEFISFTQMNNDTLIIFNSNKTYTYEAIYIEPNGDTLTNETIIINPLGEPWVFQKSQTSYEIIFSPDSAKLKSFVMPINSRQKRRNKFIKKMAKKGKIWDFPWQKKGTTGAIETNSSVWIHPIRSNQYVYTEVAPFPEVKFNHLKIGGAWSSGLEILFGWDNFKGSVKSDFEVVEKINYSYQTLELVNCWQINSKAVHSELGVSTNDFLFHEEHGFVEMRYTFYNGVRVDFRMIKIDDKRNPIN